MINLQYTVTRTKKYHCLNSVNYCRKHKSKDHSKYKML